MARKLSAREAAARLQKWAAAGFDVALVDAGLAALEQDRGDSQKSAPKKSGDLADSIRVVKPSSRRAAKHGVIRLALAAGRRSSDRKKNLPYARVLQTGGVFGSEGGRSKSHIIRARQAAYIGGKARTTGFLKLGPGGIPFAHEVRHPGSKFPKLEYLKVNEGRLATITNQTLQRSADREIG